MERRRSEQWLDRVGAQQWRSEKHRAQVNREAFNGEALNRKALDSEAFNDIARTSISRWRDPHIGLAETGSEALNRETRDCEAFYRIAFDRREVSSEEHDTQDGHSSLNARPPCYAADTAGRRR